MRGGEGGGRERESDTWMNLGSLCDDIGPRHPGGQRSMRLYLYISEI